MPSSVVKKKNCLADHLRHVLSIEYQDASGEVTIRQIVVERIYSSAKHRFKMDAICMLRKEYRVFYSDRILRMMDTSTKEFFDSPNSINNFFITLIQTNNPHYTQNKDLGTTTKKPRSFEHIKPELIILRYIAHSDKSTLHPFESAAIRLYANSRVPDVHYTEEFLEYLKQDPPSEWSFILACNTVAVYDKVLRMNLVKSVQQVIACGGDINSQKRAFDEFIKIKFGLSAKKSMNVPLPSISPPEPTYSPPPSRGRQDLVVLNNNYEAQSFQKERDSEIKSHKQRIMTQLLILAIVAACNVIFYKFYIIIAP